MSNKYISELKNIRNTDINRIFKFIVLKYSQARNDFVYNLRKAVKHLPKQEMLVAIGIITNPTYQKT